MDSSTATSVRCILAVAICAIALAAAAPVSAGEADGEGDPAYRIGPGDVVDVQVWREPDLSGRYTIDAGGALPHVLAGRIPAEGATLSELSGRLRHALEEDYLREARVSVALVESARAKASVLGAVARPGLYPIDGRTRLLELLSAAGGRTGEAAERATLLRGRGAPDAAGRQRLEIDLAALFQRGDLTQNPVLQPGDVVVVESLEPGVSSAPPPRGRVRVVGEVQRPGSYELDRAATALDAVLAAGGLSEYAAGNRARLVRGEGDRRIERRVRLQDVMEGRADAENFDLRDGDILVVPESFF